MKRSAMVLGALALGVLTLPFGAHAADDDTIPAHNRWAAIAFSRTPGGRIGRAFSEHSELVAKEAALRACADKGCEIKAYVEVGCIGLARGYEIRPPRDWYGFGAARFYRMRDVPVSDQKRQVRMRAGEAAKAACDSAVQGLDCNITETYCTWDNENPLGHQQAVLEWIQQMGGDGSAGLRGLVRLVNITSQAYQLNLGLSFNEVSCLSRGRWARVQQLALECRLSVASLDRLYSAANP